MDRTTYAQEALHQFRTGWEHPLDLETHLVEFHSVDVVDFTVHKQLSQLHEYVHDGTKTDHVHGDSPLLRYGKTADLKRAADRNRDAKRDDGGSDA